MKKIIALIVGILLANPLNVKAITTSAASSILMEQKTNRILYSNNIHNTRSVASISKVMTAILAIESGKLNDNVTIGDEIDKAYGSGVYIKKGEVLTLKDLVYGLMLRSGNDAAVSIATYVGKNNDNFVKMMNDKANELGMNDSTFNNPSGLDEEKGNFSSAYDMAILMNYAMQNKEFRKIISTKKYNLKTNKNTYIWYNKNKLLSTYEYSTGGKTGFTQIARRTLVTSASKNNLDLVVVTLNDGNDWDDHKNLFEYGFSNYENYLILDKKDFKVKDDSYYNDYKLYIENNYAYPIKQNEKENVSIKIELEKIRNLKDKQKVGKALVYMGDEKIHEENIYIEIKIEKKDNFFQKFKKWFTNLW